MKKKIGILTMLLIGVMAYGQLDTIDLRAAYFGVPSISGQADFVKNEAYKMNLAITSINNMNTPTVELLSAIVTIDSTKISGTAAGDLGHADGAILVASPGTGYTLEFVSAFIIYDHLTADYGGGGNDLVVNVGVTGTQVAMSSAISSANLLGASADKMIRVGAIATESVYADNGAISLFAGTAYSNDPGTAKGSLRVHLTYKKHTTGL